ncbi:MAG: hypothetical protein K9G33_08915 [Sneathiella sp.]|nr:hypothetical protein [Sneathiella sp.]
MIIKRLGMALGLVLISAPMVSANFQKGQNALDQNDAAAAVAEWRNDATQGDAKAQFSLGQIFEKGADGVEADLTEAYAWFKLAAAQNLGDAKEALERVHAKMSQDEIDEGKAKSVATLGAWYRRFTGQDEAAFQEEKAAAMAQKEQQQPTQEDRHAADQRAETQRALIAQRKAEAEAAAKALEESREAAITAAQQQAEEAKRQAALRMQEIEEQKRRLALKEAQQYPQVQDDARARLAALMAKQSGAPVQAAPAPEPRAEIKPVTMAAVESAPAKVSAPAQTVDAVSKPAPRPVATAETTVEEPVAVPKLAVEPETAGEIKQAALSVAPPPKPGGSDVALQDVSLTQKKISIPPKEELAVPGLKSMKGLNEDAVVEIFESAKLADLDTAAAQAEIEESLVRIEALKWSLISGAKGDKAAPKMNKVLMSKMTPVQIAEANRLAGQWLLERQKNL